VRLSELTVLAGRNRVARLCRTQRIWSVFAKKKGRPHRPGPPVHEDLVQRRFTAAGTNELWLTDITKQSTGEGKLYLCAVKDVCSGRIVGYSMDSRMRGRLAVAALAHAVARWAPHATVVHSDRGSQFRSRKYVQELHRNGLTGSMGRVGAWTTPRWSRSSPCSSLGRLTPIEFETLNQTATAA